MDAHLKERLIGAAVLVAIGVWVIPWILGGRPRGIEGEAPSLVLPTAGESATPLRTETLHLDTQGRPSAPPTAAVAEPMAAESEATTLPLTDAPSAASETAVAPPKPSTTKPAPVQSAPATAARAAPAPKPPPEKAAPAAAEPAPAAVGDWTVQLGSFGDADNAERLAERVRVLGFDAEVSAYRAGGRLMQRVRVGPQPSRERAEAVASALGAHGFVAQVVPAT